MSSSNTFKSVFYPCLLLVLFTTPYTAVYSSPQSAAKKSDTMQGDHQKWLSERIDEAHKIKPAMTEKQLLEVFDIEGGLQSKPASRYVLKSCPLIKIDVKFKTVKDKLIIESISPLYIDQVIAD